MPKYLLFPIGCEQRVFDTKEQICSYLRRLSKSNYRGSSLSGDHCFPVLMDISRPKPRWIGTFYLRKNPYEVYYYKWSTTSDALDLFHFFEDTIFIRSDSAAMVDDELPF